jgi:hypothetical protein
VLRVSEVSPAIQVESPGAESLPAIRLAPHAFVPAATVAEDDRVKSSGRSVAPDLLHEVRNDLRDGDRLDLASRFSPFRHWRKDQVVALHERRVIEGRMATAHPSEDDRLQVETAYPHAYRAVRETTPHDLWHPTARRYHLPSVENTHQLADDFVLGGAARIAGFVRRKDERRGPVLDREERPRHDVVSTDGVSYLEGSGT